MIIIFCFSTSRDNSRKRGIQSQILAVPPHSHKDTSTDQSSDCGEKPRLGILIRGFPLRSTDTSIRDGLFHDYKKYGKVTSVSVIGQGDIRHAVVSFKKYAIQLQLSVIYSSISSL